MIIHGCQVALIWSTSSNKTSASSNSFSAVFTQHVSGLFDEIDQLMTITRSPARQLAGLVSVKLRIDPSVMRMEI